ncbi:unnamed protein product [Strongylus vulgaris]|uniref:Neurotransmitter-gated ion-channel transmembrane domain-containing protein n=1 Tax=Strongylus vulgaris TaxID=40348 RepID=A0A3P7JCH5_STRVU|nr:unnamed protein product [Strongylus vulgaris]
MSILQKQFQKTVFEIEMASKDKKQMSTVNSLFLDLPLLNRSKSVKPGFITPMKRTTKDKIRRKQSSHASCSSKSEQLDNGAQSRVRNKLRRAERNNEADWQFVSMVIDRILLIIFAFSITVGTLLTIVSAPSITDTRKPITTFH